MYNKPANGPIGLSRICSCVQGYRVLYCFQITTCICVKLISHVTTFELPSSYASRLSYASFCGNGNLLQLIFSDCQMLFSVAHEGVIMTHKSTDMAKLLAGTRKIHCSVQLFYSSYRVASQFAKWSSLTFFLTFPLPSLTKQVKINFLAANSLDNTRKTKTVYSLNLNCKLYWDTDLYQSENWHQVKCWDIVRTVFFFKIPWLFPDFKQNLQIPWPFPDLVTLFTWMCFWPWHITWMEN